MIQDIIKHWADNGDNQVILMNRNKEPIAALYLDRLNFQPEDLVICELTTTEKYYLYINGIAIFFTYYKKN